MNYKMYPLWSSLTLTIYSNKLQALLGFPWVPYVSRDQNDNLMINPVDQALWRRHLAATDGVSVATPQNSMRKMVVSEKWLIPT